MLWRQYCSDTFYGIVCVCSSYHELLITHQFINSSWVIAMRSAHDVYDYVICGNRVTRLFIRQNAGRPANTPLSRAKSNVTSASTSGRPRLSPITTPSPVTSPSRSIAHNHLHCIDFTSQPETAHGTRDDLTCSIYFYPVFLCSLLAMVTLNCCTNFLFNVETTYSTCTPVRKFIIYFESDNEPGGRSRWRRVNTPCF